MNLKNRHLIIFTDLDGTLLSHDTYSFEKALPALNLLKEKNIPLVICSSKTRAEIEFYREKLENIHPFISENGGGIFIPMGYFGIDIHIPDTKIITENRYQIIILGAEYSELRKAIEILREEGFNVRGFGDMDIHEVMELTGLNMAEAGMSKDRNFDEPFLFSGDKTKLRELSEAVRSKGFDMTMGRFFHLLGGTDKGRAVSILIELYRNKLGEIVSAAIGDSPNDIPMLEKADYPIIVRKPDGKYDQRITIPNLARAEGVGPEGWNTAIKNLLETIGCN